MQRHNGVILLRDESTQRHRFTLKHEHNIGTDLEAPVVWLLLEGEERKTKSKGDRRGAGRVKEGEKERLSVRLFFLQNATLEMLKAQNQLVRTRTERENALSLCRHAKICK